MLEGSGVLTVGRKPDNKCEACVCQYCADGQQKSGEKKTECPFDESPCGLCIEEEYTENGFAYEDKCVIECKFFVNYFGEDWVKPPDGWEWPE